MQLWDGEQWPPESTSPAVFKLIFRTPNVVRSMFSDVSSFSLGEVYIYGHLDVQGSLIDIFEFGDRLLTILLVLDQGESEQHDDWTERGVDF